MARRSFKTDESFLEKLAIGAVGTKKVLSDLAEQGHTTWRDPQKLYH